MSNKLSPSRFPLEGCYTCVINALKSTDPLNLFKMPDHTRVYIWTNRFWIWLQLRYLTLACKRITSYRRKPKISFSSSEWGGQGKVESTLMAHTCGCEKAAQAVNSNSEEEEVFWPRDTRHDWVCKYGQGVDVVLSVDAQSCIHPPKQSSAWGSYIRNMCGGV